jgi:hypothetical protein
VLETTQVQVRTVRQQLVQVAVRADQPFTAQAVVAVLHMLVTYFLTEAMADHMLRTILIHTQVMEARPQMAAMEVHVDVLDETEQVMEILVTYGHRTEVSQVAQVVVLIQEQAVMEQMDKYQSRL